MKAINLKKIRKDVLQIYLHSSNCLNMHTKMVEEKKWFHFKLFSHKALKQLIIGLLATQRVTTSIRTNDNRVLFDTFQYKFLYTRISLVPLFMFITREEKLKSCFCVVIDLGSAKIHT